ncbi:serine hydrolase domain-containing protein [Seonamhaeicola marinus]|uniref:Serine hydrolase n=1 Tax=Seonamhaeicola marinus TaxID=1912246 RepID=A0A5D0HJD5_9FLAO|nr:serine hydrolase [Seonamhaeicola marinus]TYA71386.1 serine hydrolase [Seonamhaeicola marinus]
MKTSVTMLLLVFLFCISCSSADVINDTEPPESGIYFPPFGSSTWEARSLSDLGWNNNELQPLLDYLEDQNTKSFMILHDGKIVVEAYMNGHDANKLWYWASAGKTLTTALSGIAQEEGLIDINTKVSDYLGTGWTSASLEKENLITCKHLLSMNSGLDDSTNGVEPEDLEYMADAGTRWAYHNVYKKMQDVLAEASNSTFKNYFNTKLRDKIGMTSTKGGWLQLNDFNVYWSDTRSMARFGLLIYANGKWNSEQIIPEAFLNEATNTSQDINKSYGYLWWLNGKSSFHLPGSQLKFSGALVPNAPDDMFAALGKNDQKIYVVPSKKLVVIRMGEAADSETFALSSFDNDLWEMINELID